MEHDKISKEPKSNTLRILSGIILLISLITLVSIKISNPEFKVWKLILYGMLILIICFSLFFYCQIIKMLKNRNEINIKQNILPAPITLEQARELAENSILNKTYVDHIECIGEKVEVVGQKLKSSIYTYHGTGILSKQEYFIIINMHYPDTYKSILIDPRSDYEVNKAKQSLAIDPEPEPSFKETVLESPLTGVKSTTKEFIKEKEEEKKEKEEMI